MYTTICGRKIHFKKLGKGPPIIFVHGWGGDLYSLHKLAKIASSQYTCYLLDLPGFGKSDPPPPHWGIEGYARLIEDFIKIENINKPDYFGHSFGGEIGIYIASRCPDRINRLILCGSAFKRSNKISTTVKMVQKLPLPLQTFVDMVKPILKTPYYRIFHRGSDILNFPRLEKNLRKILTQDMTKEVSDINAQTLILWGEEDTYTPVLWAYELEKNIPNSKLHVFPGIGHALPLLKPDLVWEKIETFLSA